MHQCKSVLPLCISYYTLPLLPSEDVEYDVSIAVQGEDDLRHQELLSAIESLGKKK